jgi:hypothetical protein
MGEKEMKKKLDELDELMSGFSCNFYGENREEALLRANRFLTENASIKDHSIEEEYYDNGHRVILFCYYHSKEELGNFIKELA